MGKPTIYIDPVLAVTSTQARFRGIITSLEAKVAELEAQGPQTITIEVPVEKIVEVPVEVEKIVERVVEVEVDKEDVAFNRKYIQILRDHIHDLNEFAIEALSEDAESS